MARRKLDVTTDVFEVARRVAFDYVDPDNGDQGVPALAAKMGVSPGTLYNKLNLNDSQHHELSVRDFIQQEVITDDREALAALNRTLGCACFRLPKLSHLPDSALLDLITNIAAEGGDFHRVLSKSLQDGKIDAPDLAIIDKEGHEFLNAVIEALERIRGMVRG